MATYRKQLKDRNGDNILPVTGYLEDYSLEERDTGYTWTDGKHIYKKTINCGNLPNNTTKIVAHGISNISKIVRIEGTADNGGMYLPLPWMDINSAGRQVQVIVDDTDILLATAYDRSSYSAYVTLYYTKTS